MRSKAVGTSAVMLCLLSPRGLPKLNCPLPARAGRTRNVCFQQSHRVPSGRRNRTAKASCVGASARRVVLLRGTKRICPTQPSLSGYASGSLSAAARTASSAIGSARLQSRRVIPLVTSPSFVPLRPSRRHSPNGIARVKYNGCLKIIHTAQASGTKARGSSFGLHRPQRPAPFGGRSRGAAPGGVQRQSLWPSFPCRPRPEPARELAPASQLACLCEHRSGAASLAVSTGAQHKRVRWPPE